MFDKRKVISKNREKPGRIAFGDLLAYLRAKGFTIGVDQHLRLQQLLSRIEGQCAPGDVKTLLCPLFATSREQQDQFYCAFDEFFAIFKQAGDTATSVSEDPQTNQRPAAPAKARRSRAIVVYGALSLLVVSIVALIVVL